MPRAYIALGSNLGDRAGTLDRAVELLRAEPGIEVRRASTYHETRPVGGPADQGSFLNAAAELETTLEPRDFLAVLHRIERALGRTRRERWEPRTLDLDLLFYADRVLATPELTLPHPRIAFRRFVLEPLAEIAPEAVHPALGCTIRALVDHIRRKPHWLAIAGGEAGAAAWLARAVAAQLPAQLMLAEGAAAGPTQLGPQSSSDFRRILRTMPQDRWLISSGAGGATLGPGGPDEAERQAVPTFVARLDAATKIPPPIPVLDLAGRSLDGQVGEIVAAMSGIDG